MVDFMYYGEVNVSTEQLPQILKTAEMLKIKGLAEMPDAASVTKSTENKSGDHTDGNQSISGVESMWGNADAQQQQQQIQQQQQQQQQYHQIRRTPSPSCMSPATRRKRLRKTSSGSATANLSASSERIHDDNIQHHQQQQQQQIIDGEQMRLLSRERTTFNSPIVDFTVTPNVRGMKMNSSPDGQMQHQQDEHHIDDSHHITEMVSVFCVKD